MTCLLMWVKVDSNVTVCCKDVFLQCLAARSRGLALLLVFEAILDRDSSGDKRFCSISLVLCGQTGASFIKRTYDQF